VWQWGLNDAGSFGVCHWFAGTVTTGALIHDVTPKLENSSATHRTVIYEPMYMFMLQRQRPHSVDRDRQDWHLRRDPAFGQ